MHLPRRLLAIILKQRICWETIPKYFRLLKKRENTIQRIEFIKKCKGADIIPRFLKFRVPTNGAFEPTVVHNFQRKLLNQELRKANELLSKYDSTLEEWRKEIRNKVPVIYIPSVIFNARFMVHKTRKEIIARHQKKLENWSAEQQRPLFCLLYTSPSPRD